MKLFQFILTGQIKKFPMFHLRATSFKVLNYDFDINKPALDKAKIRSKAISNIMEMLTKFIQKGGGEKAIHRHTVINKKLLVRERLKLLFDQDFPFFEIGFLAGMYMDYGNIPAAGFIAGIGKIHGQYCLVGANDATVKGGTVFPISLLKQNRLQQLAYLNRLPCIYLIDSGGAFLPLQAEIFPDKDHGGRCFYNEAVLSSLKIPQIAVVCGSSTAGAAYIPTMAEEAIIVKKSGVIFLAGPPLVKAATGEIVTEQDLGGAEMHCSTSGCTDYFAESEEEAISLCRESILTLKSIQSKDDISYSEPLYSTNDLLLLSGKELFTKHDMYVILSRILDGSMFKEFKEKFGGNLITGFGFVKGILIGILANCDSLTYQDAQKGTHFIQLCDKRNLPMCFIQSSNFNESTCEDKLYANLQNKAKMIKAHSCSKVPIITLCVGGCYEDDIFTMCGWDFHPNFFLSWPLSHISPSKDLMQKVISEETAMLKEQTDFNDINDCRFLFDNSTSALFKSSKMLCDAVISPKDTREVLSICLDFMR